MSKPIPARHFAAILPAISQNLPSGTNAGATLTVRSFDLPTGLFAATVGLYFAFLAIMAVAFADPGLIVPMGIFYIYIIMAFGVPALWVRMKPDHAARPLGWAEFLRDGIATHTGQMTARDASCQVLILPVMIFGWGVGIAAIVAIAV